MQEVTLHETTYLTPDIECDGCANAIRKALKQVEGVADVQVDVCGKSVLVTHEAPQEIIAGALARAGFTSTVKG